MVDEPHVEIEAKMKVESFEPIRARLREVSASRVGIVLETNVFFDTPAHALRAGDRGLRVRSNRNIETGNVEHVVTYKGPRQPGALKRREERECVVKDSAAAAGIFEALGYAAELSFEKRRESWKLDDCRIELDELPLLGMFVEIEGPSEAAVDAARERLKLQHCAPLQESYIAMLMQNLNARGDASRVLHLPPG
jgi:adenylate cyclase class 2